MLYFVISKIDNFNYIITTLFLSNVDGGESGLIPDEYDAAVATLQSLASTLDADCVLLRNKKGEEGITGQYLVRKRVIEQDFLEIR